METSFTVGAKFILLNEASPTLAKILTQIRELNLAITRARENLSGIGSSLGIGTAVGETQALARAWTGVAEASAIATRNMTSAAAAGRSAAASAATSGGGGRHRPGWLGMGGGGRGGARHGHFSTPGLAAAAALGWGVDQAVKGERFIWDAEDISGLPHDDVTHAKFRKMMNDFQVRRGRTVDETGDAMLSAVRLNQGTPGGGIDNIPEFLDSADTEARRKRTGLNEAMTANVELAHQFKAYTPDAIRKLMATFAGLSTADPRTLAGMTRAAGYAVPTLSALGVDPTSVLLAGTALAGAGVSSTKSGTWIREAVTRAMPAPA
jgi:hypothetical protein